jgi:hypothetical protein
MCCLDPLIVILKVVAQLAIWISLDVFCVGCRPVLCFLVGPNGFATGHARSAPIVFFYRLVDGDACFCTIPDHINFNTLCHSHRPLSVHILRQIILINLGEVEYDTKASA